MLIPTEATCMKKKEKEKKKKEKALWKTVLSRATKYLQELRVINLQTFMTQTICARSIGE